MLLVILTSFRLFCEEHPSVPDFGYLFYFIMLGKFGEEVLPFLDSGLWFASIVAGSKRDEIAEIFLFHSQYEVKVFAADVFDDGLYYQLSPSPFSVLVRV